MSTGVTFRCRRCPQKSTPQKDRASARTARRPERGNREVEAGEKFERTLDNRFPHTPAIIMSTPHAHDYVVRVASIQDDISHRKELVEIKIASPLFVHVGDCCRLFHTFGQPAVIAWIDVAKNISTRTHMLAYVP